MKKVMLGRTGNFTLVDDEDFGFVSRWKWHIRSGYASRAVWLSKRPSRRTNVSLHRVIAGAVDGDIVDHINGNPLDNRRSNLRRCSQLENSRNRKITLASSQYKGVCADKSSGLWGCNIRVDGVLKSLGSFEDEVDAAKCYNAAAIHYFREFARLNPVDCGAKTWQELSVEAAHRYNKKKYTSRYMGVSFNLQHQKWIARHARKGKEDYLGLFETEIDAALCVDAAIFEKHGADRPRNFLSRPVTKTVAQIQAGNSNKTSMYKGVKRTKNGKWQAQVCPKGVEIYLGTFEAEIEAAIYRDKYVVKNDLKRIVLNFPEE